MLVCSSMASEWEFACHRMVSSLVNEFWSGFFSGFGHRAISHVSPGWPTMTVGRLIGAKRVEKNLQKSLIGNFVNVRNRSNCSRNSEICAGAIFHSQNLRLPVWACVVGIEILQASILQLFTCEVWRFLYAISQTHHVALAHTVIKFDPAGHLLESLHDISQKYQIHLVNSSWIE